MTSPLLSSLSSPFSSIVSRGYFRAFWTPELLQYHSNWFRLYCSNLWHKLWKYGSLHLHHIPRHWIWWKSSSVGSRSNVASIQFHNEHFDRCDIFPDITWDYCPGRYWFPYLIEIQSLNFSFHFSTFKVKTGLCKRVFQCCPSGIHFLKCMRREKRNLSRIII